MTPFTPTPRSRAATLAMVVVFTLVGSLFIHSRAYSSNDASRLAAIESLVERGTWAIDASPFATVDRIKVGEHFYSDKPPILSLAGAGVYSILHNVFGLTLQPWGCTPERVPTWCRAVLEASEADWAYFILTLLLVGLPATLMLVLIYRLARRYDFSHRSSLIFVAVLGLGTSIFPYSTVFTNHVPAAASTLVAFYLLMTNERSSRVRLVIAGLAAALAATIDLSTGIFAVALLIYVIAQYRSGVGWFTLGAIVPLLITIVLDVQIVGNPLLPQLYSQGYTYAGSEFGASVAGNQSAANVPRYAFDLLIGERGVLMFYPILLWYIYAAIHALRSTEKTLRSFAWLVVVSSMMYTLYFALSTSNFGGYAYSPRWLLNPIPLLAIFAVTDRAIYRPRWRIGLVGALAVVSIISALYGALNPWSPAFPLLQIEYTAPQPIRQPAVAMSGYSSFNELPSDYRQMFGVNNIVPRRFDARRGLVIPNEATWYFVDESTPLAPELAGSLGLGVQSTYALNIDLTTTAQQWLKTFETTGLPITFSGEVTLLGYKSQPGDEGLAVITAWRVETPRDYLDQRRIVIELSSSDGNVVQRDESMAARYSSLQPGDILLQIQRLSLKAVSAGKYQLQIGVLKPDTGERLRLPDQSDRLLLGPVIK